MAVAGITLYRSNPDRYLYQQNGYGFHLVREKNSQIVAAIVSTDTTAPIPAAVRATYHTGRLWHDWSTRLKDTTRAYKVAQVTGLSSREGPIDLSNLATDTVIALKGQSVSYRTSNYSLVATQTANALVLQSCKATGVLPARLFCNSAGKALPLQLSPDLEAELLASVTEQEGTPVKRSSDYDDLLAGIDKTVEPYQAIMSASTSQKVAAISSDLKDKQAELKSYEGVLLDVPLISQKPEFPAGCEAASTAMLITYAGHSVSTADIVQVMPYASNPNNGYVGNPRTWQGWTIFPSAMKSVVKRYVGSDVDLTGSGLQTLYSYLRDGKPVVVWLDGACLGSGISLHCVCVTGYGQGKIYYNDPYRNVKDKAVSVSTFTAWWARYDNRAMSY